MLVTPYPIGSVATARRRSLFVWPLAGLSTGYGLVGLLLGRPQIEAVFVGAAMVATSVGITARVLRDLGVIASTESRIILGAAVIDDILAMIILAIVAGLATSGVVSPVA